MPTGESCVLCQMSPAVRRRQRAIKLICIVVITMTSESANSRRPETTRGCCCCRHRLSPAPENPGLGGTSACLGQISAAIV
ncbi:hypothetical protein BGZ61DRAFT_446824 [Ilyonectria robusta]|uniref:uncharacterized protein n=1 Tax=Ilyonectria robusta TaxID=1079257 RepID=UPI001E8D598E|nr:uncharacterized protein BGZ61DRAFT_446824 [Ilyonectria robusta]KAH8729683.1 hypothetical protein BGZ61DRAFT_446824 [Ilyonectria robusta]